MEKIMTREQLINSIAYDKCTGIFTRYDTGKIAGSVCKYQGYVTISILGKRYKAHRLAWYYEYGEMPKHKQIDHINHNRSDNRISNLRLVTHKENSLNQKKPKNNTSGQIGVYWNKKECQWMSRIMIDGKRKYLGLFDEFEEAVYAYEEAKKSLGFHKNHGGN